MQKRLKAFSILEVSLSLLILGLGTISAFKLIQTYKTTQIKKITKQRQLLALHAIGRFVTEYGYIPSPCPASKNHVGKSETGTKVGILPWKTLKIPYEYALDGYGHFMTYAANAYFTNPNRTHDNNYHLHPTTNNEKDTQTPQHLCITNDEYANYHQLHLQENGKEIDMQSDKITHIHTQCFHINYEKQEINEANWKFCSTSNNEKWRGCTSSQSIKPNDPIRIDENRNFWLRVINNVAFLMHQPNYIHPYLDKPILSNNICFETEKLPIEKNCPILIIISHGTTGGYYKTDGVRSRLNSSNKEVKENSEDTSNKFHINIKDQITIYATRFNLQWYGGPACYNLKLQTGAQLIDKPNTFQNDNAVLTLRFDTSRKFFHHKTYHPSNIDTDQYSWNRYPHSKTYNLYHSCIEDYGEKLQMPIIKNWKERKGSYSGDDYLEIELYNGGRLSSNNSKEVELWHNHIKGKDFSIIGRLSYAIFKSELHPYLLPKYR